MTRYAALLRGVNVGGNNLIRMTDLRACFQDQGFADVTTYIQSGNVVFGATGSAASLTARIERALGDRFGYGGRVLLVSERQLRRIVEAAPERFGSEPGIYRSDVIYLFPPLRASAAIRDVPTRDGVDRVWAGPGVLYVERLASRAAQSRLSKIASLPIYPRLTIRNWNTTRKLLPLVEAR